MISTGRLAAALLVALLAAGCVTTPAPHVPLDALPPSQVDRATRNMRVFDRAWSLVTDRHYDPKLQGVDWPAAAAAFGPQAAAATDKTSLYAAINGMLALLKDSHTHALTPEQATERSTRIRARTGFNMTRIDGRWAVAEVLPGSPAEAGGVKTGWLALARNGEKIGERTDFHPAEGEVAQWEFLDEKDRVVTLSLVARPLSTKSRQIARELPGGFLYLRFDEFDGPDRRWLSDQLKDHREAPGVVIDLRRNPGGETLSLGISIGEFFDRSVECGTFITRGGRRSVKNSWQFGSAHFDGRVVVLIDGSSASAAEIFSAVLQDHGRATIVGRKSAGAVLASWFYTLPDGGELQLSREDYLSPKGRRLEGNGVVPNVEVPFTLADVRAGRDPDLDAALRVLRGS